MIGRSPARVARFALTVLCVTAVICAVVRAQSEGFYAKRAEIRKQAAAAQAAAGLAGPANRKKLFVLHPTPEVLLKSGGSLVPGVPGPVAVGGTFSDKTVFVSGTDSLTLANEVVGPNTFRATATVKAGTGPHWVRVYAIDPVSGAEQYVPVFCGTPQSYTLTAKNGWTIQLTPDAKQFAMDRTSARVGYKAEYFRKGEAKPFETATGELSLNASAQGEDYSFSLQAGQQGSAMAEMETLNKRLAALMQAGKTDGKEFEDLMKKMESVQARMVTEMQSMVANPAAIQKKEDDFGCGTIYVSRKATGLVGHVSCGKNVGHLDLAVVVK